MVDARSETHILLPAMAAWCDEAQRIVAYPEDYGMTRHDIQGLKQLLADRFPPSTVVYSGHGPETTLGAELAANPFLAELRAS